MQVAGEVTLILGVRINNVNLRHGATGLIYELLGRIRAWVKYEVPPILANRINNVNLRHGATGLISELLRYASQQVWIS